MIWRIKHLWLRRIVLIATAPWWGGVCAFLVIALAFKGAWFGFLDGIDEVKEILIPDLPRAWRGK